MATTFPAWRVVVFLFSQEGIGARSTAKFIHAENVWLVRVFPITGIIWDYYIANPNGAQITVKTLKVYHRFALLDSPQIGLFYAPCIIASIVYSHYVPFFSY